MPRGARRHDRLGTPSRDEPAEPEGRRAAGGPRVKVVIGVAGVARSSLVSESSAGEFVGERLRRKATAAASQR